MATDSKTVARVTDAYLACALWASTDDDGEPLDGLYHRIDLHGDGEDKARADVCDFLTLLENERIDWRAEWSLEELGTDFWLTRNGHGSGFWDRGRSLGTVLTKWAKTYGEATLYVGDDGQVWIYC